MSEKTHKELSVWQGAALIASATIGAGVLGIPYVISHVGICLGSVYIVLVGLVMIGLNELVGAIALETHDDLQLVGYAKRYLGPVGGAIMTALTYLTMFGAMVVYLIGEGEALSALFGGDPLFWSLVFFGTGMVLIFLGIKSIKSVEFWLTILILAVVLLISAASTPHILETNLRYSSYLDLLLPYGVLLFAYHGTTSVPEVKQLLKRDPAGFRRAIRIAGYFAMAVYLLFALVVVGVTGTQTTEIATIGLGEVIGPHMVVLGNIFAVLAMGTSFLMIGLSLRDSLRWDYKLPVAISSCIVSFIPLCIFLLGVRSFIAAVDIVGGVFISTEMFLLIVMYLIAKREGYAPPLKYKLHHTFGFAILAMIAFTIGAIYSVTQLL